MTTQVAVLEAERGASVFDDATTAPQLIPLNVTVLGKDMVRLSEGGPLPVDVKFDPETGNLSIPVGYFKIAYTIVTAGASFNSTAIAFEVSDGTYIGLPQTTSTTAEITTENALVLGTQEQLRDYTLLCVGPTGVEEPHDPTIVYEPPGG